jgi:hypothetical protein
MGNPSEGAPAQAAATPQNRKPIRRPVEYTAKLDTLQVIVRFLIRARDGAPFTFKTFKDTWKQIGFSYIFQVGLIFVPMAECIP